VTRLLTLLLLGGCTIIVPCSEKSTEAPHASEFYYGGFGGSQCLCIQPQGTPNDSLLPQCRNGCVTINGDEIPRFK